MRFRHIAGGLAVAALIAGGVPAAASAATWQGAPASGVDHGVTWHGGPASRVDRMAPWHNTPAWAGHAAASKVPWKRYVTKPWQDAPGKVCSFGVNVTIVRQHEQYRTTSSYPDGRPRVQQFRGPLFARYTNASTGKSLVGNLSGYGWFYYTAGGGTDIYVPSHLGLTVPVGNKGFPAGEWIFSGRGIVYVSNSGQINVVRFHATLQNVCRALS
jgi:hypothetical protein